VGENQAVKGSSRPIAVCIVAALVLVLVLTACSSGDDTKPKSRSDVPKGFAVPAGVRITDGGSTLRLHTAASVVYTVGEGAASAITVAVNQVTKGDVEKDFSFFSLDKKLKDSTPYYVRLSVLNNGPSGLGALPQPGVAEELPGGFQGQSVPRLPAAQGREAADHRPPDRQGSRCHPLETLISRDGLIDRGGCILARRGDDRGYPY
jgi:hypothetical protein